MDIGELPPAAERILVYLLLEGANRPGIICEGIDHDRVYVSRMLSTMTKMGLIRDKGDSVYTLTKQGMQLARILRRDGVDP